MRTGGRPQASAACCPGRHGGRRRANRMLNSWPDRPQEKKRSSAVQSVRATKSERNMILFGAAVDLSRFRIRACARTSFGNTLSHVDYCRCAKSWTVP